MAEVGSTEVALYFFEVVDDICDVFEPQVFLRVLWKNFQVEIIENLFLFSLCPVLA